VSQCNSTTGLTQPLQVCSQADPCTNAIIFSNGQVSTNQTVTTASDAPTCAGGSIDDGLPLTWTDAGGVMRYTCLFKPASISPTFPTRPLLLFFHGTGGYASDVYNYTAIRVKAINYDLTGDLNRPGFILAAVQGRNLHWPAIHPPGRHHDYYYRNMGSPSSNPDVAHVDHLIDTLVEQGIVDPQRIYTMGWSNGATFAQFYAIARHATATPGGNHIAAAAAYAFADPFNDISRNQTPSCKLNPYPISSVPLYLINRTCDALTACNAAQETAFNLPPGYSAEDWVAQLQESLVMNDPTVTFQRIDSSTNAAIPDACQAVPPCDSTTGTSNHLLWPNGLLYGSGTDWEPEMLNFLKSHPHP
jgi:poly(3-hydroxybutyrate) depolymerase